MRILEELSGVGTVSGGDEVLLTSVRYHVVITQEEGPTGLGVKDMHGHY